MVTPGLNMEQVKQSNRASILKYINDSGESSRKDIAKAVQLTPAAVTQICNVLIEEGLLLESGTIDNPSGAAGRKKVLVKINYESRHPIVISIEQQETTIAVTNMKGDILKQEIINTDTRKEPEDFLKDVAFVAKNLLQICGFSTDLICVTIPGLVDRENGISILSYGIWNQKVNVCKILKEELGVDVCLDNNVRAYSLAELIFGVGKEQPNFLLLKWGPGVGSSIVINGKIYEGRHGKNPEIGHMIVNPNGERCSCGKKGCLETIISYHSLQKIMKFDQDNFAYTLKTADENTKQKFDEIFSTFAVSIINCIATLAPNRVVLCGKLFKDEYIRNIISEKCMELDSSMNSERILYTTISEKASIIGPVAMYIQKKLLN